MLSDSNQTVIDKQIDVAQLDVILQRMQRHLEAEKERIYQEIKFYPLPIPACDVQYNGLLSERAAIRQELDQVAGILEHPATRERIDLLDEFVQSSQFIKGELLESIRLSQTRLLA